MAQLRLTYATAMVLQALAAGLRHGFDIIDATGLRSGTVYPVLRRLEAHGLARSQWEAMRVARSENRVPRKYYRLTRAAEPHVELARERYPTLPNVKPLTAKGR
jgi:PadR family transcriptional regulator PadR